MSLLKKLSLIFLIILVLLITTVTVLLTTSSGIRFLVNTVTGFVPELSIGHVDGNLKNLTLGQVKFDMVGVNVSADELKLSIDFSCFKNSKLCVNQLAADNVQVNVDTSLLPAGADNSNSEPLTELETPYPIELRSLVLNNTQVNVDAIAISLAHFSTGASWQNKLVTLLPTTIKSLLISLPESEVKSPTVEADSGQPIGKMLEELFSKPILESLPEIIIPVDVVVQEINGEDLRLVSNGETIVINDLLIKADLLSSNVNIETFKVTAPQGTAALIGNASLKNDWPLSLTFNSALNTQELRGEKVKLQLDGNLVGDLKLTANVSGPVSAQLIAETSLDKPDLPLSLTLESKKVQWPISGKADYKADNLRLRLTGKASDYVLSLRSELSGADIPPATMTIDGKGNTQQFKLSRLRLSALEGKAELSGVADWSKAISWNALLTLDGINTIKQWPEWPATIQGKVTSKGSVHGGSWQLELPEVKLTGNVKKQKLNVAGSVSGNAAGQWRIPDLLIELGKNRVTAKGELGNNWLLDANISAPNLNDSLPGLRGVVNGQLKLRGTQKAPQLLAELTASGLKWQDLSVANINLNSNITAGQQVSGDLNLIVERLIQGDTRIRQLTVTANGNEKNHQLELKADGRPFSGNLMLTGQFDRATEYWKGTLSQTRFNTPFGEWSLSQTLPLDYRNTNQRATIGIHCWVNQNAELCLPKVAQIGKSGQIEVQLKRFDLSILKGILRESDLNNVELKGIFSGNADFSWQDNGQLPRGKVALRGDNVETAQIVNGARVAATFDDIRMNADINNQSVKLDWMLKLVNNGQFSGNIDITDPQNTRRLAGNVIVDSLSLEFLKPLLAGNERAEGIINGRLRLSGNSKAPQISGDLNLDRFTLTTQWSPVTVTQGNVNLKFNGTSSVFNGLIKTQRGELVLTGDADWRNIDAWRAKVIAKGDRIRIQMPPTVQLDVSPNIVFEATPALLKLTGTVAVPWARITVEELPESAVGISSDEVILDNSLQPVTKQSASIPIASDVMISIGPDVSIDAFGLEATLAGNLKMTQDNRGLGLHGDVNIPSGSFRAYGQNLLIKSGLIIFAGPPDQPQLNIDAIRNPDATEDGVTAGLRITGFADRPNLEIYTDPAMSQEEALSYLLRGQGLEAENGDNALMTSMLIGLGAAQSGRLVGRIGETFGVQNLTLDTQGVGDSSQVVVSGYVLPRLQVKYGVGIFDSLATLTLRYRLMPRLYLEAISGVDQALDVLYQFEF